MPNIEIDDELFAVIDKHARERLESHNSILRTLLGLGQAKVEGQFGMLAKSISASFANKETQGRQSHSQKMLQMDKSDFLNKNRNLLFSDDDVNQHIEKSYLYKVQSASPESEIEELKNLGTENNDKPTVDISTIERTNPNETTRIPTLPHHIPTALEHTLQMIYLVRYNGMSRIDATKILADWHRVAVPTITIKFTRLLDISSYEVDSLLQPENIQEFRELLVKYYPEYEELIDKYMV